MLIWGLPLSAWRRRGEEEKRGGDEEGKREGEGRLSLGGGNRLLFRIFKFLAHPSHQTHAHLHSSHISRLIFLSFIFPASFSFFCSLPTLFASYSSYYFYFVLSFFKYMFFYFPANKRQMSSLKKFKYFYSLPLIFYSSFSHAFLSSIQLFVFPANTKKSIFLFKCFSFFCHTFFLLSNIFPHQKKNGLSMQTLFLSNLFLQYLPPPKLSFFKLFQY